MSYRDIYYELLKQREWWSKRIKEQEQQLEGCKKEYDKNEMLIEAVIKKMEEEVENETD